MYQAFRTRHQRDANFRRDISRRVLHAHSLDTSSRRPEERDACPLEHLREGMVLSEEPISGVQERHAVRLADLYDRVGVEVSVRVVSREDERLIGKEDMGCLGIGRSVDSCSRYGQAMCCTQGPNCDFATVSDEQFVVRILRHGSRSRSEA